jgi:hypothetical protein
MAQMGWVFVDNQGRSNRIGLYHGDSSGHVLIHCNLKIMQVDFSVKDDKAYTFFIEDELCEIRIFKEKTGFSYEFYIDRKTDTPLNRVRKKQDMLDRRKVIALAIGFVLLAGSFAGGLIWYNRQQKASALAQMGWFSEYAGQNSKVLLRDGRSAVARLSLESSGARRLLNFEFSTADSVRIAGRMPVADTGRVLLPNGFPLLGDDAFQVLYLPADPNVHFLNFSRPTEATIAAYLQRATQIEAAAHPTATGGYSFCLAALVLREKGWSALANVIFQLETPESNPEHNRDAYLRLLREPEFARKLERNCWDR